MAWSPIYRNNVVKLIQKTSGALTLNRPKYLDDERGSSLDNFGRQLGERTVFNAHDLERRTKGKFKREIMQTGIVVDVQRFQHFQCA